MLPAAHRLTDAASFRDAARRGRRAAARTVVVHALATPGAAGEPRVGFVVSKAVGGAVVRTRVKRRLRHVVRDRLADLPAGATVVVRALPAAGETGSAELARDVDRCLTRVTGPGREVSR